MRSKRRRVAAFLGAVALLVAPVLVTAPAAYASPAINGGGSGFAALEIQQWKAEVARRPLNLTVNYSSQGSSVGRADFASGLFDFGASDIVFPAVDANVEHTLQTGRCNNQPLPSCFKYVPVSAGGLGIMYNLLDSSGGRINTLKLTRQDVCRIFTGEITNWNDPELVQDNSFLANVANRINVVVRSDGAGESYVLSQFCQKVDPADWTAFMDFYKSPAHANDATDPGLEKGDPISSWPQILPKVTATPESGSDGVANEVADPSNGQYSITYDAAGYAKVRNFPVASVQNAAGQFTQPIETNVTVALQYATQSAAGDGTFELHFDGADTRAYFPSTYSYVLAQTGGYDPGKGTTLAQFLCWAVGQGQSDAPTLGYARLSSQIVAISVAAITAIPGAPPASSCGTGGPPPPPPPPVVVGTTTPPTTAAGGGSSGGSSGGTGGSSGGSASSSGGSSSGGSGSGGSSSSGASSSGATGTGTASASTGSGTGVGGDGGSQSSGGSSTGSEGPSGAVSGSGAQQVAAGLPASVPASARSGPTNNEALWSVTEGVLLGLVVIIVASGWKRVAK